MVDAALNVLSSDDHMLIQLRCIHLACELTEHIKEPIILGEYITEDVEKAAIKDYFAEAGPIEPWMVDALHEMYRQHEEEQKHVRQLADLVVSAVFGGFR